MLTLTFNGQEVVRDIRKLGFWEKMVGLGSNIPEDRVYFRTRWGIHTFGLKKPIDVLVLNNKGEVGAVFRNLIPGQMRFWNIRFKHIFEFPAGTLDFFGEPIVGSFVWYDK